MLLLVVVVVVLLLLLLLLLLVGHQLRLQKALPLAWQPEWNHFSPFQNWSDVAVLEIMAAVLLCAPESRGAA